MDTYFGYPWGNDWAAADEAVPFDRHNHGRRLNRSGNAVSARPVALRVLELRSTSVLGEGRCINGCGVKTSSMPRVDREYPEYRFGADTVRLAYTLFKSFVAGQVPEERQSRILLDGEWHRMSEAKDFFETYATEAQSAELAVIYKTGSFLFSQDGQAARVEVGLPNQADIARILAVFETAAAPAQRHKTVFVGHGRDPAWVRLSEELAAQADLLVRTYENSIGAGVTAIELLEQFGSEVDFAVLIHTCDREENENSYSPSPNVVHETGFFQGRLGRHRTLVVRERGCPSFHNIGGLHEVTFDKDRIEETVEQILQLIRSELSPSR